VVEVAPAVAPDLAAVLPAVGVAGEQQLEGLGEAGLAAAVAADDEREAGAGREVARRLLADAAEAFGGDAPEEGDPGRGGFLLGLAALGLVFNLPGRLALLLLEERVELGLAFERGQHQRRPRVLGLCARVEPLEHEVAERGRSRGHCPSRCVHSQTAGRRTITPSVRFLANCVPEVLELGRLWAEASPPSWQPR
jgi:hypothetical protein